MSWLVSLFSGGNRQQNVRRGQAMSTTHEAFSLPTSSPTSHVDAFNPDTLTPDPDSARSYTYPPPSPMGSYGYMPTSRSNSANILPLHNSPLGTPMNGMPPPYPPLHHTWNRMRTWLGREYPELGDTLNYGILPQDLAQIEMQFGMALPTALRESYLIVDGQEAESSAGCSEGLFFGLTFLPLEDVLEEWRFWREVDDDPATGANARLRDGMQSIPAGWVRKEYSQRGWIPLIVDKAGNYAGVDLNPDEKGAVGQVIVFGRDFDTKVVLWRGDGPAGWAKWLASFVDELESGEGYELGGGDASEGSEDGLGYESYYYDGTGRGQGDGGGDTSAGGGLKLTGEYRGWSVLEAWADRSLRKWYDSGIAQDPSSVPQGSEKTKPMPRPSPDILSLAKSGGENSSGAEVIMPVLTDDNLGAQYASHRVRNSMADKPLPTINITKPPAPLPVDIPTTRDMGALPSPPDSTHSSLDLSNGDLESGRAIGMRNLTNSRPAAAARASPKPALTLDIIDISPEANVVPLPGSPSGSGTPEDERLPPPAGTTDITNLLDDESAPAMGNIPIEPVSPIGTQASLPPAMARHETQDAIDVLVEDGPSSSAELDTTIRLVGGGGSAGPAIAEAAEEVPVLATAETSHDSDVASLRSTTSVDSVAKGKKEGDKKHKKGLSSGLKKLGHFGRKKDSNGSIKVKESA